MFLSLPFSYCTKKLLPLLLFLMMQLFIGQAKAQQTPLSAAIKNNDLAEVKKKLDTGADPNEADADGDNLLMYAALYASADVMERLLEKGADPIAKNKDGETPLMWSIPHPEKIKRLLQHGAIIDAKAETGNTAFLVACVGSKQHDLIKLFVEQGADPFIKNHKGETALMRAALFGDTATLSYLLGKGIDINARANDSTTALINAIFNVNREATIFLLNRGADADLIGAFGLTAVSAAVTYNDTESIKAILQKAKNIDAVDRDGYSSLMWAAYNEHDNTEIIQSLLDRGANVNLKAKNGTTALSWALQKGNTKTVALLKKAGAK
jgi:ankyrin repeat protein